MKEKVYEMPILEIIFFTECIVRTSFGDDGNDGDWDDENTNPKNSGY